MRFKAKSPLTNGMAFLITECSGGVPRDREGVRETETRRDREDRGTQERQTHTYTERETKRDRQTDRQAGRQTLRGCLKWEEKTHHIDRSGWVCTHYRAGA